MRTEQKKHSPLSTKLALLTMKLRRIERGRDSWSLRWQAALGIIDLSILGFFILGPYLRSGPSYLIIDYAIAVWILIELGARAVATPSLSGFLKRPMTWIDIAILATLLFPDELFNYAFLRAMRLWAISDSPLLHVIMARAGCSAYRDVARACLNFLVFLFMVTGFVYTTFFYRTVSSDLSMRFILPSQP